MAFGFGVVSFFVRLLVASSLFVFFSLSFLSQFFPINSFNLTVNILWINKIQGKCLVLLYLFKESHTEYTLCYCNCFLIY